MTAMEKLINIPKEYQGKTDEWCSGYLEGHRAGVEKERAQNGRKSLRELFPEYFINKEKAAKNKSRTWTMTEKTLAERDKLVRNDLIVDIYTCTHEQVVRRYQLCYYAALAAALNGLFGFGEIRVNRVIEAMQKQLAELGRYVRRNDQNAIMTWCQRRKVKGDLAKDIFMIAKNYRVEEEIGVDDLEFIIDEEVKK